MHYKRRLRQRAIYYYTGLVSIYVGGGSFLLIAVLALARIYFQNMTEVALIGLLLIGFGTLMSVVFSSLGWNKSVIIDFGLNQLSLISTIIGFFCLGVGFLNEEVKKLAVLGCLLIFIGIVLANLGMKFSSSPPSIND